MTKKKINPALLELFAEQDREAEERKQALLKRKECKKTKENDVAMFVRDTLMQTDIVRCVGFRVDVTTLTLMRNTCRTWCESVVGVVPSSSSPSLSSSLYHVHRNRKSDIKRAHNNTLEQFQEEYCDWVVDVNMMRLLNGLPLMRSKLTRNQAIRMQSRWRETKQREHTDRMLACTNHIFT
jgi:hypothetical protein